MQADSSHMQSSCQDEQQLYHEAMQARKKAYAPYSGFLVGAALLCQSGAIFHGCNIENASYPLGLCAERAAIAAAVSAGERLFTAIAICGHAEGQLDTVCYPCGACRQVLAEFCAPTFRIILHDATYTLDELLPHTFDL